jgi:hypothetical protein
MSKIFGKHVKAPNTDWQTYTPTFSAGFGTVTGIEFEYRRVGDSIDIRGKWTCGTVAASEAQIGLPASLSTADVTKIPTTRIVGQGAINASTVTYNTFPILAQASKAYLNLGNVYTGGTSVANSPVALANGNSNFTTGQQGYLFVQGIPVSGLSSKDIIKLP